MLTLPASPFRLHFYFLAHARTTTGQGIDHPKACRDRPCWHRRPVPLHLRYLLVHDGWPDGEYIRNGFSALSDISCVLHLVSLLYRRAVWCLHLFGAARGYEAQANHVSSDVRNATTYAVSVLPSVEAQANHVTSLAAVSLARIVFPLSHTHAPKHKHTYALSWRTFVAFHDGLRVSGGGGSRALHDQADEPQALREDRPHADRGGLGPALAGRGCCGRGSVHALDGESHDPGICLAA